MAEIVNTYALSPKQMTEALIRMLPTTRVPMISGSPGIGKSDLIRQIAKRFNLLVIDLRLSQCAPEDLMGFPMREGNKANFVPFSIYPLHGDPIPEGYDGWILFLDEFNSAPRATQAAAYKVVLDRYMGSYKIHDNCLIVCAGNKASDRAIVTQQSTATQSRLIQMEMRVNSNDWLNWAIDANVDYRVRSYIEYRPQDLHVFRPEQTEGTFPCPRTWVFASDYLKLRGDLELDFVDEANLAGCIGDGKSVEFTTYLKLFKELPSYQQIVAEPENTTLPNATNLRFATVAMLGEETQKKDFEKVLTYAMRLPPELLTLYLRTLIRKDGSYRTNKHFRNAFTKLAKFMTEDDVSYAA